MSRISGTVVFRPELVQDRTQDAHILAVLDDFRMGW